MNAQLKNKGNAEERQRGSVLVLVAVSLTMMLVMLAFAFDYGWIILTKSELQSAADSAALAGAAQLMDEDEMLGISNFDNDLIEARDSAEEYAQLNEAANVYLSLDRNDENVIDGGVVVGYIEDPFDIESPMQTESIETYNSVEVVAERSDTLNGPLGLFLGGITGVNELNLRVRSTATLDDRVVGFGIASNWPKRLGILPFSLHIDRWNEAFATAYESNSVLPMDPSGPVIGAMGIPLFLHWMAGPTVVTFPTVKMYPYKEDTPGNFGTIDIGSADNSASVLKDQIENGASSDDMALICGLKLTDEDEDGIFTKWFNGDTGMSATLKESIVKIYGQPRILPLHRQMIYNGNNAMFEVCQYVGVKVVSMKMTGAEANRYIEVQPYQCVVREAEINPMAPHSKFVFALSLTR